MEDHTEDQDMDMEDHPQVMGHMDMAMEDQIVREGEEEKCVVDASFSNFFNII